MNRKHNPIVALVALILMILLVAAVCTGCDEAEAAKETAVETESAPTTRFTIELKIMDNKNGPSRVCRIITDKETGVQYLFYKDNNAGGLTKLEPAPEGVEAET